MFDWEQQMTDHICTPGCTHGITPENERDVIEEFDTARRSFLRSALVGGGAVSLGALGVTMSPMSRAATNAGEGNASAGGPMHYFIPGNQIHGGGCIQHAGGAFQQAEHQNGAGRGAD